MVKIHHDHKILNKQVGIQFVRFGDDNKDAKRLHARLDTDLNLDL